MSEEPNTFKSDRLRTTTTDILYVFLGTLFHEMREVEIASMEGYMGRLRKKGEVVSTVTMDYVSMKATRVKAANVFKTAAECGIGL